MESIVKLMRIPHLTVVVRRVRAQSKKLEDVPLIVPFGIGDASGKTAVG